MRKLAMIGLALALAACAGPTGHVANLCDKTTENSVRKAAREGAANEGAYIKCVEPGRSWHEYTLTLDGQPVP